jgi:hypothetical protein
VTYLTDLMGHSEAAVRDRLAAEEQVVATGRCADITTTGDLDSAGAAWTYVMVTNRHVHWVPDIKRLGAVCSLNLDQAQTCTQVHWRHRPAMVMEHDPLIRVHLVPNGRLLNWEYTSVDSVIGPLSETILGFSRPTTAAAEKLKEQLALRGREIRQVLNQGRLPWDPSFRGHSWTHLHDRVPNSMFVLER